MNQKVVLGLMVFLALMLPLVTFLSQLNQENRSLAYTQLGQSCKNTSSCQPPLICSNYVCKKDGVVRMGNKGLNESCGGESDCRSPYKCYGGVCKVRSGGECSRSGDCFSNHYCSRSNHHCRSKEEYNLGDYSVEGISVSSMLGHSNSTTKPTVKPTTKPTVKPTTKPTVKPTVKPTASLTGVPTLKPTIAMMTIVPSPIIEPKVSFKIAFAGISPEAECIDKFLIPDTKLELNIVNITSNNYQDNILSDFEKTDEVDSKGNQIFKVTQDLDKNIFGLVDNFNYIKVKGPWHLKRKMCQDGQNTTLSESTVCNVDLKIGDNIVYDFSEYTLLSGDIDKDGVINTVDLNYIKTVLNSGAEVNCGIEGDLNMDGIVNTFDLNLVKDTLAQRDNE